MINPIKFSILISTKNRLDELMYSLNKLESLIQDNLINCVIIDDGSIDGTFEKIKQSFPKIQISRNEISKGYMFCRNKMLNETQADFAISLDDDANFLIDNPIEIIQKYFENNTKCGVIAARIFWNDLEPNDTSTIDKPQIVNSFVGCGHIWRMKAWKTIPNYPEWFQFYGEENFASMQLFKKGWEVHYVPEIFVHHRVNLKKRSASNKDGMIRFKNAIRADWYNYLIFLPFSKMPRKFGYSIWMQFKNRIFKGNFKLIKPLFKAKIDLIKNNSNIRKNRNPFTKNEFEAFSKLEPAKIFWKPENSLNH